MSDNSAIEWTDATWNPVTGCTKVSQGCKNCYAERLANRLWGGRKFTDVQCHPERLDQPLRWKKPRRVFVNSMSDLFHESVPDEFIAGIWARAIAAPQHTFQILTKRPKRMAALIPTLFRYITGEIYTPPNIWLGVSVEDRASLWRIDSLRQTPAAVRFLSLEPLLQDLGVIDLTDIHWVIVGGESGPKARPMHPDWVRSLRDQCQAAGVPFFFKQWGEYLPCDNFSNCPPKVDFRFDDGQGMHRVGKKTAGRLLDGREWNEYPVP